MPAAPGSRDGYSADLTLPHVFYFMRGSCLGAFSKRYHFTYYSTRGAYAISLKARLCHSRCLESTAYNILRQCVLPKRTCLAQNSTILGGFLHCHPKALATPCRTAGQDSRVLRALPLANTHPLHYVCVCGKRRAKIVARNCEV